MKTKVLLLAAVLVTAYRCMAIDFVLTKEPRIFKVVDAMTVLVHLNPDTLDDSWVANVPMGDVGKACIVGVPTKDLYESGTIPNNCGNKVLLIPAGVYKNDAISRAPTQLRKLMWIHPNRIRKETLREPGFKTKKCRKCDGKGRLNKRSKGELGNRVCPNCGGSGNVTSSTISERTLIFIDGKLIKGAK